MNNQDKINATMAMIASVIYKNKLPGVTTHATYEALFKGKSDSEKLAMAEAINTTLFVIVDGIEQTIENNKNG